MADQTQQQSNDELLFDFGDDRTPQNIADCPEPGKYTDVQFEEYLSWRAVNSGVIKWGRLTPKHFDAAFNGRLKSEDTKDKRLGRAIHCRSLEPDEFDKRFVVAGRCEATFKTGDSKGKQCGSPGKSFVDGKWYCGKHGDGAPVSGVEVLTDDEHRRTIGVSESLKKLPSELRAMLSRPGWSEVSIVWKYKGLKIKGRMDRYAEGKRPCIIDMKKVQVGKGGIDDCRRAVLNYLYHVQAAIYVKGVEFLTGKRPEFLWLFVEDNDPFDVNVIPATEEDIDIGWRTAQLAIQNYLDSQPDCWGYIRFIESVKEGGLPPWFVQQERDKYAGI